jgi:hypothetical protein
VESLKIMISGKRLKDISDLPLAARGETHLQV